MNEPILVRGALSKNLVCFSILVLATIMVVYTTTGGKVLSSSSSPSDPISIKIVNPDNDQTTNVKDKLVISGESRYAPGQDCHVSVIVNDVKPYQKATPTGAGVENNYSTWNYTVNSDYTTIKEGDNRVTARLICSDDLVGDLRKWYSLNVVGQTGTERIKSDMISIPIDTELTPERSATVIQIDRDTFVDLINERIGNNTEAIRETIMYAYTGKK